MCRVAGFYSVLVLFHLVRSFLCSKSCLVKHAMLKMLYLQGVSHFPRFPSYPSLSLLYSASLSHPLFSYFFLLFTSETLNIYLFLFFPLPLSLSLFPIHPIFYLSFWLLFEYPAKLLSLSLFLLPPPSLMPSSLPSPPFNLIHSIPLPCVIVQKMLCYLELGFTIYLHSCRTAGRCYGVVVGFRGWGWEGREVLKFALFSYVHNLKFEVLNTKKTNVCLCKCILMSLQ